MTMTPKYIASSTGFITVMSVSPVQLAYIKAAAIETVFSHQNATWIGFSSGQGYAVTNSVDEVLEAMSYALGAFAAPVALCATNDTIPVSLNVDRVDFNSIGRSLRA